MKINSKLQIYKKIAQYLMKATEYSLKNIAGVSGAVIQRSGNIN